MGYAAYKRLQRREQSTTLERIKVHLQFHMQETREQQTRLMQLIKNMSGTPTQEKGELPISKPPESIGTVIHNSMTRAEQEPIQIVGI